MILQGIRVIDFSRVFAGPAATQLLGDMGAEVIKIEARGGDETRHYGKPPSAERSLIDSAPFNALNRNKRSIVIDLKADAGRDVALRLVRTADIVVHNFRPGVMERLGLGYEDLQPLNPHLIYAEFTAYGDTGPLRDVGANDLALQAHSGLISITGAPGQDPVRCGSAVVDLHGSLALVVGILGALYHRTETGQGQKVASSLMLSAAHLMSYFYTEYWEDGTERAPMGTANHLSVPNQAFPASDGQVVIIASTDPQWRRVCDTLGDSRLGDPRFATVVSRKDNREALVALMSEITAQYSAQALVDKLGAAKVTCSKVNSIGEAATCAQLAASGGRLRLDGPLGIESVAPPVRFGAQPQIPVAAPPAAGADSRAILSDLGLSEAEIAALIHSNAVSDR